MDTSSTKTAYRQKDSHPSCQVHPSQKQTLKLAIILAAREFESLRLRSPQGAYLQALQGISDFNPKFIQSFWVIEGGWNCFVNRKLDSENVKEVLPEGGASFLHEQKEKIFVKRYSKNRHEVILW